MLPRLCDLRLNMLAVYVNGKLLSGSGAIAMTVNRSHGGVSSLSGKRIESGGA